MKIRIFLLFAVLFAGTSLIGQTKASKSKDKNVQTAVIKTKIYCDHCKICESCGGRILQELYNEDGIRNTEVDPKANTITVIYDTKKLTVQKVRVMISKLGFDADNVKADPAAVQKLDDCCRKPG